MRRIYVDWILCFVCVISFSLAAVAEDRIDLSGRWRFRLDPDNAGAPEKWFNESLPERIRLSGTTDQAKKLPGSFRSLISLDGAIGFC
jgi:hypothetical protein